MRARPGGVIPSPMIPPAIRFTAALITGHPRARSVSGAMAEGFADGVRLAGGKVVMRDLYRLGFDPCLHPGELPGDSAFKPRDDVLEERRLLADVDLFAFFYPLWYNAPPAIVKGYVDRVFGMGFAYSAISRGGNRPLLTGRRLITFTTSGAPQAWVERSGAWAAMQKHFDDHFAAVTGLESLGHHNIGGVGSGLGREKIASHRAEVEQRGWRAVQMYGRRDDHPG